MVGININDKEFPFTEWILDGSKVIETRNSPTLRKFLGQRVGIIRTGCGKPYLVGYATIEEEIIYESYDEFHAHECLHMVEEDSIYDWDPERGIKFGYWLSDVERCHAEIVYTTGNRIYREI